MEANEVKDILEEEEWALVALALISLAQQPTADLTLQGRLTEIAIKLGLVEKIVELNQALAQ